METLSFYERRKKKIHVILVVNQTRVTFNDTYQTSNYKWKQDFSFFFFFFFLFLRNLTRDELSNILNFTRISLIHSERFWIYICCGVSVVWVCQNFEWKLDSWTKAREFNFINSFIPGADFRRLQHT